MSILVATAQKAKIRPKALLQTSWLGCMRLKQNTVTNHYQISPLWELRQLILENSPGRVWPWSTWNVIHRRKSLWTAVLAAGYKWLSDEMTILWHNYIHDCCTVQWYISNSTHLTSSKVIQCDQPPQWSSSHQILHQCSCSDFRLTSSNSSNSCSYLSLSKQSQDCIP